MVADLLRGFVGDWTEAFSFSTLEKLSSEYVGGQLHRRSGDMLWRLRFHADPRLSLLILLEFQSAPDPVMAARILSYVGLALDESSRQQQGKRAADEVSIVLPGVIYNGASSWNPTTEVADLLVPRIRSAMGPVSDALVAYQPRQRHFLLDIRALDPASLPSDNWVSRLVQLEQARWTGRIPDITELGRMVFLAGDDHINRGFTALLVWGLRSQGITIPELEQMQYSQEGETLLQKNIREWKERILLESREKGLARVAAAIVDCETGEEFITRVREA